ncbi:hypothetical protein PtB15_7B283 [Puccinia triticina]|nr:hypothetical protein PtB15_7B283 [Puccinia triticina]
MATLDSLPVDIIHHILTHLDLRSTSRLSRASRSLHRLTRSDSLWRRIAKTLVGPWTHRARLTAVQKPPPDWTTDPNCFPLSQFSQPNPSHHAQELPINSWYQFCTRFLIPHFHFLGWHVSNILPHGQLILVTYDTSSGRLRAEEIKCRNLYSTHPDPFFIHPFGLGRPEPSASAHPSAQQAQAPVWPSWLPLSQIHLDSNRVQYSLAPGVESPEASRYTFDIFAPLYVASPLFSIFPFEPHYRLACVPSSYQQITIQKPSLIVKPWSALVLEDAPTPLCHPTQIIARRANILSREVLAHEQMDMVSDPGPDAAEFHSLTLASSPETPAGRVDTAAPNNDPRIRYQGGARQQQAVRASNILLGGRTYTTNGAGLLRPVVHFPVWSIEYYPLIGPPPLHPSGGGHGGPHGLWVGCYGSHGTEFGHIIVEPDLISFVKLTGDPNIPAGQLSWKVRSDRIQSINPIPLTQAISIDLGTSQADPGWLKGLGQVANTNYEEPGWINTEVQFISNHQHTPHPAHLSSDHHLLRDVEQIRVKWIELGRVSTFFKVVFP